MCASQGVTITNLGGTQICGIMDTDYYGWASPSDDIHYPWNGGNLAGIHIGEIVFASAQSCAAPCGGTCPQPFWDHPGQIAFDYPIPQVSFGFDLVDIDPGDTGGSVELFLGGVSQLKVHWHEFTNPSSPHHRPGVVFGNGTANRISPLSLPGGFDRAVIHLTGSGGTDGITSTAAAQAHIGDDVWHDLDGDGVQGPSEPGIPGVTVNLLDPATFAVLQTTTTDPNGSYGFDVAAGTYVVQFVSPVGFLPTTAGAGADPALDSNAGPGGLTGPITVSWGTSDLTIDAGFVGNDARIGDFVWLDQNNDGVQGPAEPGVAGVTVNLLDVASMAVLQSTSTDAVGWYEFTVPAGNYVLQFVPPAGLGLTAALATTPDLDSNPSPATGLTSTVIVGWGDVDLTIDAGIVCSGPPAMVTTLGPGCGPGDPILTASLPVLGTTIQVDLLSSFPSSPTWIFYSAGPVTPFVHTPSGCTAWVDALNPANLYTLIQGFTDSGGDLHLAVPIPLDPTLLGLQIHAQGRVWYPGGPLGGDYLSNGVLLTIGC